MAKKATSPTAKAIRKQLSPELRKLYNKTPDPSSGEWLREVLRLLFAQYLQTLASVEQAEDELVQETLRNRLTRLSEEMRKWKYISIQDRTSGIPDTVTIGVIGPSDRQERPQHEESADG